MTKKTELKMRELYFNLGRDDYMAMDESRTDFMKIITTFQAQTGILEPPGKVKCFCRRPVK